MINISGWNHRRDDGRCDGNIGRSGKLQERVKLFETLKYSKIRSRNVKTKCLLTKQTQNGLDFMYRLKFYLICRKVL